MRTALPRTKPFRPGASRKDRIAYHEAGHTWISWCGLFTVAICLLPACGSSDPGWRAAVNPVPAFLASYHQGVVFTPGIRPFVQQLDDMQHLGIDAAKFWLDWSAVQPRPLYYHPADRSVSAEERAGDRWFLKEDLADDPGLVAEYAFPERPGSRFRGRVD